jgi:soluble lytic murein transglycosylase-like protein
MLLTTVASAEDAGERAFWSSTRAERTPTPASAAAIVEPAVAVVSSDLPGRSGYAKLIAKHAYTYGVPAALADAMVRLESRYNASARNGPNLGLTQISVRTARALGYAGAASGLLDADTNLRYGVHYLALAYRLAGGDVCHTILKYQSGHRATRMTGAARAYCARVHTIMVAR